MSKINLTPNASGTGVFTIASPNSNTDRTLNLPDKAGTVNVGEGIDDNATSTAVTIDSSGNVGIGTASPNYLAKLDVQGGRTYLDAGSELSLRFLNSGTAGGFIGTSAANTLNFYNGSGTERMRIDSSGNLHSGGYLSGGSTNGWVIRPILSSSSSAAGIETVTSAVGRYAMAFRVNATSGNSSGSIVGSIYAGSSSTSFNTSSDYRLKENVVDLDNATDRLKQIPVHRFNFIADPDTTVDGFIAHEVQDVVPEAITGTKDAVDDEGNPEYQGIDQSKLVPLLTAALQEAVTKIEDLESRLSAVEAN